MEIGALIAYKSHALCLLEVHVSHMLVHSSPLQLFWIDILANGRMGTCMAEVSTFGQTIHNM